MQEHFILKIKEHSEDHSEDERTGGESSCSWDDEYEIDLAAVRVGELLNPSPVTGIIIDEISHERREVRFRINRGSSLWKNTDTQGIVTQEKAFRLWDPYRSCDKTVTLMVKQEA